MSSIGGAGTMSFPFSPTNPFCVSSAAFGEPGGTSCRERFSSLNRARRRTMRTLSAEPSPRSARSSRRKRFFLAPPIELVESLLGGSVRIFQPSGKALRDIGDCQSCPPREAGSPSLPAHVPLQDRAAEHSARPSDDVQIASDRPPRVAHQVRQETLGRDPRAALLSLSALQRKGVPRSGRRECHRTAGQKEAEATSDETKRQISLRWSLTGNRLIACSSRPTGRRR